MKENVTLSDLKAGARFIRKTRSQFFTIGKEYLCETDGHLTNNDGFEIAILISDEEFNRDFSLLTPQQPERLLSEADKEKDGLKQKYYIQKIVPNPNYGIKSESQFMGEDSTPEFILKEVDPNSEYFLLRLDSFQKDSNHRNACLKALHTYANEIADHLPELSKDLIYKYGLISQTAQEEVKGEEDKDLAVELIARFHGTYGRNNQWGKRIKAAFVDGALWKEKKYHEKTSLLQQEVEKLRELLKDVKYNLDNGHLVATETYKDTLLYKIYQYYNPNN